MTKFFSQESCLTRVAFSTTHLYLVVTTNIHCIASRLPLKQVCRPILKLIIPEDKQYPFCSLQPSSVTVRFCDMKQRRNCSLLVFSFNYNKLNDPIVGSPFRNRVRVINDFITMVSYMYGSF